MGSLFVLLPIVVFYLLTTFASIRRDYGFALIEILAFRALP